MAKTYKNLYPQIYGFANLYQAFRAARKGGKRKQVAVASFEFDLERNLLLLEAELRDQTYRPSGYTNFFIDEPKRRLVSAAPFRDRVVHQVPQVYERAASALGDHARPGPGWTA